MEKKLCVVTCQGGLEEVLAQEIKNEGIKIHNIGHRMVSFYAEYEKIYRCNMSLRTAISILIHINSFQVKNYDHLYFKSKKIKWHKLFSLDKTIKISIKGKSDSITNSQFAIHRIKDGITDTFRKFFNNQRPSVAKNNPDIHIVAFLNGDDVSMYLDSSGEPLFKRGYRNINTTAPIKEDLAAGIILLSDWDQKSNVLDPMCGSGTFLYEAFMIANKIAPNINRNFSFMNWFDYDESIHMDQKIKLQQREIKTETKFTGIEIDRPTFAKARKIYREHFLDCPIKFICEDFTKNENNYDSHLIVTNPPYGERIGEKTDIIKLYKDLGDYLKQKCKDAKASIFTANIEAGKQIGLKPSRKIVLYNGPLEGRLFKFEIY